MNRKKYITLTLMLSLLCMNKTYAACTQEEINEFKKVEDEFKITYEFDKTTKDYKITMYNPDYSKYGYRLDQNLSLTKYYASEDNSITYEGVKSGEYTFGVIIPSETCQDILKTIKLNLPKYNKLSEDPLCDGIEEFVLCQPTYDKEIDYDTFISRINTYKRTKTEKEEEIIESEEDIKLDKIIEYIENNILEIIIIVIFTILMVITIALTAKSIKKSRRLE